MRFSRGFSRGIFRRVDGFGPSAEPVAGQPVEEEIEEPGRPLPDRLVSEMTVHRTITLRDALAGHPDLAFLAVLHALCLTLFSPGAFDTGDRGRAEAE